MTIQQVFQRLLSQFGEQVVLHLKEDACDPWIEIAPAAIDDVAAFLKTDEALAFDMLSNLTAVDYFESNPKLAPKFPYEPHLEVVYHLFSLTHRHRVVVKVKLPRWKENLEGQLPEVPTVSSVWAVADWHEREAFDLVGIVFTGHPNLVRILCAEDWVGHPLRKDYEMPHEYHGVRAQ